ncbi:aminodeoxychorismate/anthranilate synthase component II [bacterium]|nr:aminodeoxychorismate/anthranilate synthase component II [bacterium]MBU1752467.1 aminodeoxychorismate/anthranilate synthase component II [bacterium]
MILIIDNYDSFTYNLVQYLGEIVGTAPMELLVKRNDKISLDEIRDMQGVDAIIISPGPRTPKEAGISVDVIKEFAGRIPILGVCLGHQSIGYAFGGKIIRAKQLMHGKTSLIYHDGQKIYEKIENPFVATRYHSLVIDRVTMPECLSITAWTEDGEIMGVRHREYAVEGVQFHPESILTEAGRKLLCNFIKDIVLRHA